MYENYSRQALPTRKYRELLGSALCVFNSNNNFIIENFLSKIAVEKIEINYNWFNLQDKKSGQILEILKKYAQNEKFVELFELIIEMRNRIIHSFQITTENDEQMLATKTKIKNGNQQFRITEEYLLDFIKKNEELSDLLYKYRDCLKSS